MDIDALNAYKTSLEGALVKAIDRGVTQVSISDRNTVMLTPAQIRRELMIVNDQLLQYTLAEAGRNPIFGATFRSE